MMFDGKHILVTGASSGIGRETAIYIAKNGGRITSIARRKDELVKLSEELYVINGQNHQFISIDLTNDDEILNCMNWIDELDGIVHAAGIVYPLPLKFIKRKHINEVMNINFIAPVLLTSALLSSKKMHTNASIVFISSISTKHPYFGGALYVSSKAALEAYSKSLALELVAKKIRCNIVSPALVKTAIFEQTMQSSTPEKIKQYEKSYPLGFGEVNDVAKAICFLLSDDSSWITGQEIILDGGLALNKQ